MAIVDTAVHEFDVVRWLLGEEFARDHACSPRKRNSHGGELQDPLLMLLETESGVLVDVETSVNIRYGYDIRCEVVGEDGTAALGDRGPVVRARKPGRPGRVPADWRERFIARLRRRSSRSGSTRSPPASTDRAVLVGRLRRHRRLRRRRRGPAQRRRA